MAFDDLKTFNGKTYSGMLVGAAHHWDYTNGIWDEKKISPDVWQFRFESQKRRQTSAPEGSGVPLETAYNWYIVADQKVVKNTKDVYQTVMEGTKYKIGHKRPYWRDWSYGYPDQMSYRQRLIQIFRETLTKLELEEAMEVKK